MYERQAIDIIGSDDDFSILVVFEILVGGIGLRSVPNTAQARRLCHHFSNCTSADFSQLAIVTSTMSSDYEAARTRHSK